MFIIACQQTKQTISLPKSAPEETFTGTVGDVIQLNKPMRCTGTSEEGMLMLYINGNNVRMEITSQDRTSFIITKGNCSYYWDNEENETLADRLGHLLGQGSKGCFTDEMLEAVGGMPPPFDQLSDVSARQYNVQCTSANIPADVFEPPTNIDFLDNLGLG